MDPISKYVMMALGMLLMISSGTTYYFYHQFQNEVKAVQIYKDSVGELERNQAQKDNDIKLANQRIDEFTKAAQLLATQGKAAQDKAAVLAKKNESLSQELLNERQRPGEDVCTASKRLMGEYLEKRKNETPAASM